MLELELVESRTEIFVAHRKLETSLRRAWRKREDRRVTWRPTSKYLNIHHNGKYWFASEPPNSQDKTPRYWDPYGEYKKNGNLQIAVEINTPASSDSRRVAGFFAKDATTGTIYLMHNGGVGGGQRGVGRAAFLAWSNAQLVPVRNTRGDVRPGIVVAPIDSRTTADEISRFIQQALDFKKAVANGETDTPQARSAQRTYKAYYNEFAGKKRRQSIREIEYVSHHGDIVQALYDWRRRAAKEGEEIVKNAYIDLGIQIRGTLIEIYEVKTNCARQTLYSAIGQILVHDDSQIGNCKRFLVLPNGEQIPDDVNRALGRASISLLRFYLNGSKVRILDQ